MIHLGERDCSIQRRHQKLIEESPAPLVDDALRERIGEIAVEAARAVGYRGAGTIEGLLQDGEYFFLEMNTRVQVEHCVTEATTGIDIVREQIRIAAGEPLSVDPGGGRAARARDRVPHQRRGRARRTSPPRPGTVTRYREPSGPGVRVDSGVLAGSEITPLYDPMVAKLIVWDVDREAATRRMPRALEEFEIEGVRTLIPFHKAIMASEQWARGGDVPRPDRGPGVAEDAGVPSRPNGRIDGGARGAGAHATPSRCPASASTSACSATRSPRPAAGDPAAPASRAASAARPAAAAAPAATRSPRRCRATSSRCSSSRAPTVEEGALVCIIEAMKMENEITAHKAGVIAELPISEGAAVSAGDTLAVIKRRSGGSAGRAIARDARRRPRDVLGVDLPHRAVRRASGSGASAPRSAQRLQVRAVLAQDRRAPRSASSTAPWPGHDVLGRARRAARAAPAWRGRRETEPPGEIHGISTGER